MKLSYKDLIDVCYTKARYYQDKASELNDANYLSDSKAFLAIADCILKCEQEVAGAIAKFILSQKYRVLQPMQMYSANDLCQAKKNAVIHLANLIESGKWREYL